ncbi:hypothetical protein [Streptomyces sp. NPDC096323]|uniref:hypothetical protein n=1 Tax=Streptomyces sp. NPDC096323 TaxID=3155822 RepID=UPI003332D26F
MTATSHGPRRVTIRARRAFTRCRVVKLLREATGRTEPDRRGVDWPATVAALCTALPGDYKDIAGRWSRTMSVLSSSTARTSGGWASHWLRRSTGGAGMQG